MASQHSLNLSADDCSHYYNCVLYDVPQEMPLSEVAGQVVPQEASVPVAALLAQHCKIVPHRLHMYKEPLNAKFGFITYFVHVGAHCTLQHHEIHSYVLDWIRGDLPVQLMHVHTKVRLAQPPECYSCNEFLRALTMSCDIVNPTKVMDSKKMETFVLSKVDFNDDGQNRRANGVHADAANDKDESGDNPEDANDEEASDETAEHGPFTWHIVGRFPYTKLSSQELVWLKKQATDFPPLLVTDNDFANAHCDTDKLRKFFETTMGSLFELE